MDELVSIIKKKRKIWDLHDLHCNQYYVIFHNRVIFVNFIDNKYYLNTI
jgi:hypothetical protein